MFAARGIAVSFSVFLMVYCALSLAVLCTWRRVCMHCRQLPARRAADLLFTLRMLPLMGATLVTAAFTVPSFLLLEPRTIDEPLGAVPLALGACGAALGIFGAVNALLALRRASRTISSWSSDAQRVESPAPIPVLRTSRTAPAMTAAGIVRPRVLISTAAESLLTSGELQTALCHELEHVRRRDNPKKLMLRFVAFPGMGDLEAAWLEATEMSADDAAVSNAAEALDLASALIKLSRFAPAESRVDLADDLTAALVHGGGNVMTARIQRLIAWSDQRSVPARRYSSWSLGAVLGTVAIFTVSYTQLLVHVHTVTEWLVR